MTRPLCRSELVSMLVDECHGGSAILAAAAARLQISADVLEEALEASAAEHPGPSGDSAHLISDRAGATRGFRSSPPGLPVLHARRVLRAIVAGTLGIAVSDLVAAESAGRSYGELGRERGVSVNQMATALVAPLESLLGELPTSYDREHVLIRLTIEAVELIEVGWPRPL